MELISEASNTIVLDCCYLEMFGRLQMDVNIVEVKLISATARQGNDIRMLFAANCIGIEADCKRDFHLNLNVILQPYEVVFVRKGKHMLDYV